MDDERKYEKFDAHYFQKPLRFQFGGIEVYAVRFREVSQFFSDIYEAVMKASDNPLVMYNIRQIGFLNSVRTDDELIDPPEWERLVARLDGKVLSMKDIVEWLKSLELHKANFNVQAQINTRNAD